MGFRELHAHLLGTLKKGRAEIYLLHVHRFVYIYTNIYIYTYIHIYIYIYIYGEGGRGLYLLDFLFFWYSLMVFGYFTLGHLVFFDFLVFSMVLGKGAISVIFFGFFGFFGIP